MAIVFNNVSYNINSQKRIISNANFEIKDRRITAIVGSSGSGRTTLLELMCGIKIPTNGFLKICDFEISKRKKIKNINQFRKHIGYSAQYVDEFFLGNIVRDEFELLLGNYDFSIEQINYRIKELRELFGFEEEFLHKKIADLSNSEKKILSFAISIAHNPDIIILDEPACDLDFINTKKIIKIIRKLKEEYNKTIVIVSNDLDTLIKFVDDIIVVNNGQILLSGNKMDVFSNTDVFKENNIYMPQIIEFSDIIKTTKGKKIGYYDDIKDLMKAVYRNV